MQPLLQKFQNYLQQGYEPSDISRFVTWNFITQANFMQPLLQQFQNYLQQHQRLNRQGPRTLLVERATTRVAPTAYHSRSERSSHSGNEIKVFSPSPKLSPGLSNQPKAPIYSFWQSQSQIANLPSIL